MDVGSKFDLECPSPMNSPVESWDPKLFCQFHEDVGHETKDCKILKRALDGLEAKGFLNRYTSKNTSGTSKKFYKKNMSPPLGDDINHIDGEFFAII